MPPQAIDTAYRGFRFRSRLEARWAVFYTTLNIPFDYEPQGFVINGKPYLPDFWLPKQDCWVEIKGEAPTNAETDLAAGLAEETKKTVYIFYGSLPEPKNYDGFDGLAGEYSESAHAHYGGEMMDLGYWWCVCWKCGLVGIEFNGRSNRLPCPCPPEPGTHGDKGYSAGHPKLVAAYDAARGARFEHEERFKR